jgi:hypothetical protein
MAALPERNSMKDETIRTDFSRVSERTFHELDSRFLIRASCPFAQSLSVRENITRHT